MAIAILIVVVILIVIVSRYIVARNQNTSRLKSDFSNKYDSQRLKMDSNNQLVNSIQDMKITITTSSSYKDDSIIDITGQSSNIPSNINLKKYTSGVPFWAHHYVYSFNELMGASYEQKGFYHFFKGCFLKGEYLDLEGNTNYAFILLFDLLNEYETNKKLLKLENHFNILGQYYPKTKPYCNAYFAKILAGDESDDATKIKSENEYSQNYYYDNDYWSLGTKYKAKLKLNEEEVKLLNKLWYPTNNFCSIEYCFMEILKLYVLVILELNKKFIEEGSTIDSQFISVADVVARKHYNYRNGSHNYKYCLETTTKELYSYIFKHCENAVREYYGHKRKISTDIYYSNKEIKEIYESVIVSRVSEILPILINSVAFPDEETEIQLYTKNTGRWKFKFEELTKNYDGNIKKFTDSIHVLAKLNQKNPSIENIFFDASKFIAKYDKESALILYIHYLYYDLISTTFDNKRFTKTIQKNLFKTNEQLHDFEIIVSELINDKNLDKALKSVSKVYEVKRKKIRLDTASIKEVQQQHSGTVELLNEYLKDDYEDENNTIKTEEMNKDEILIEIVPKIEGFQSSAYESDIAFTPLHLETLELFVKSNFSLPQLDLELFAKSKSIFKNQLVESINEACYDLLDDVLIEEEDDFYAININDFQRISVK
ncbi:MAG: hypothetical protein K8I03_08015 [Ignavibacteria bacterium]|nr:hypothetical protein [Ignavibacteria bacterium]